MQSLAFVLIATIGFLAISVLLVLRAADRAPRRSAVRMDDALHGHHHAVALRHRLAVIVLGLVAVHVWLPAGKRKLTSIVPGIIFTLVGWLVGSTIFATYLDSFANYVNTYAGLASIMIAIVFLYMVSAIFIVGARAQCRDQPLFRGARRVPKVGIESRRRR